MNASNSNPATASSELPSEIWRWDATDIAAHIRLRTITSSDAVQSCLDRIAEVNPHLNAIVHMVADNALREAKEADAALKNNAPIGPLHGVPVTIKLNVDVKGEATTNGVAANRNLIAPEDSAVVANLRKAGAIILGRTNTPPFSHRWFTENPLHGRTLNPWNDDVTPGGSSGGAAVSVAAGMCPLAHSTDIAGSTRYPAYACGVVGLRTTPGRVPAYSPTVGARLFAPQTMSAQGPIARTIRDAYLGLAAMSPRDTRDPVWVDARLDYPDDNVPVRVALIDEVENVIIASEVKAALIQAAKWLAEAGYEIESVRSPSLHAAAELWLSIARTEAETGMFAAVAATKDPIISSSVHDFLCSAPALDVTGYVNALKQRDAMRREWNMFLSRYPLMLMPTSCQLPFRWGEDLLGPERMRRLVGEQSPLMAMPALSLPGLNVPVGIAKGLPVGVQLVADRFREHRMLAAGAVIERAAVMPRVYD